MFKDRFTNFSRDEDLCKFYVVDLLACDDRFKELGTLVKLVMVLLHGNAAVESGFSINKVLSIDNMLEETVVAQRVVFDAIRNAGMDIKNIDLAPQMVCAVRQSIAAYKAALVTKKRDRAGEEQNMKDSRKCKALISSLEQQKRLKLDELKSRAQEIDKQIAELKASK